MLYKGKNITELSYGELIEASFALDKRLENHQAKENDPKLQNDRLKKIFPDGKLPVSQSFLDQQTEIKNLIRAHESKKNAD